MSARCFTRGLLEFFVWFLSISVGLKRIIITGVRNSLRQTAAVRCYCPLLEKDRSAFCFSCYCFCFLVLVLAQNVESDSEAREIGLDQDECFPTNLHSFIFSFLSLPSKDDRNYTGKTNPNFHGGGRKY